MNSECQSRLTEARKMLAEAQSLNAEGQYGAAMKLAYEASEFIAAGYMAGVTDNPLPPCDGTYDVFAKLIQAADVYTDISDEIGGIVSSVCVLREAYEPVLLEETTAKDAEQMINSVNALLKLVEPMPQT